MFACIEIATALKISTHVVCRYKGCNLDRTMSIKMSLRKKKFYMYRDEIIFLVNTQKHATSIEAH